MTIGIYSITHVPTGRRYIGKSVNAENRLIQHKHHLTRDVWNKNAVNPYLYNAVQKYGWSQFRVEILQRFRKVNEELISSRELYWIDKFKTTDAKYGFNLRRDSSTGMIVHESTRQLMRQRVGRKNPNYGNKWTPSMKKRMSKNRKRLHAKGEIYGRKWRLLISKASSDFWKNNPDVKTRVGEKISKLKHKYNIVQMTKDGKIVKRWYSIARVIESNPDYKRHNIYSVCSGEKPTMYGFIWKKVHK